MTLYFYKANLIRVVDGDTVILDVDLGFGLWRKNFSYRLLRINAPELRSEGGLQSKDRLIALCDGKQLYVTTVKADSFGRYLVELMYEENGKFYNINDSMVSQGFASYI
jgi:micrococcal nuclease